MAPSNIPDWIKPTLRRSITGESQPDTQDLQVVSAALAGVELDALKTRFEASAEEIQNSLLRVVCAVREGKLNGDVYGQFPDLESLRSGRKAARKKVQPETVAMEVSTAGLPDIIPGDDESLHAYLVAVKNRQARTLAPLTLQSLEVNVSMGKQDAINKSLEMFYGVGRRGPGVAMQFNMGGAAKEKAEDTPHFFEETVLSAEKEDGSLGGEVTMFDERLLGQQEE